MLSREDPEESFLKGVPSEPDSLELIYPRSFEARLVRRRLRLLLRHQHGRIRRRLVDTSSTFCIAKNALPIKHVSGGMQMRV